MTKQKKKEVEEQAEIRGYNEVFDAVEKTIVAEKKKKEEVFFVTYITELWKGKIEIHKCVECEFYSESKDDIISHVLTHLPQAEQSAALDYLMEA